MYVTQRISHVSLDFRVLDDDDIDEPKLLFKFNVKECRRPALLSRPWLTTLEVEVHRTLLKSFSTGYFEVFFHERMSSCVQDMLSSIEILQPSNHEYLRRLIADRACDKSRYLSTTHAKSMNISVDIKLDTVEVYEEGDDESEEISDFLGESMEVEEESKLRMKPTSRDAIQALQKVVFEGGDLSSPTCVVCFDRFIEGMAVKMMPCSHIFHGDCIAQWLGESNKCPLCRFEMPV